ncbi:hypothetical protein OPQ81_009166 [Rhizoctonia solani]|nr:hypothetical protein OPQ81_009166 [Rhizoctonia solani]
MGCFDDIEHGDFQFEEGSDTLSEIDEHEQQFGLVGQAAPTTGSAFDSIDLSCISASTALFLFAEACCEEFRLSAIAEDDVVRTVALPGSSYMSICLYACIMVMGQDATKTQVEDFFKSNTFKENIKCCTAQFVRHMRENPLAYEIPQVVQEGAMTTKRFSSAVGEILSGFHGELHQKIFGSIEDKTDIASTGEKLAIQGFQLSKDHLKQYALLQLSEDYINAEAQAQAEKAVENTSAQPGVHGWGKKKKSDGGLQKVLAFWTYVNSQMFRFQQYPMEKCVVLLKGFLHQDRKKYPDLTNQACWYPPLNQLVVSQWQANASYMVQVMASYTLTAVQEGQEALLIDLGVPGEYKDQDVTNQMGPEEGKEDGTTGGDNGGQVL